MTGVLNATTVVRNPQTTAVVTLHEGTTVPEWARDLVGDHLVAGGEATAGNMATPAASESANALVEAPAITAEAVVFTPEADPGLTEPPRAGRGSGLEPWTAYAESLGLEVSADAGRDEVIELVVNHRESAQ